MYKSCLRHHNLFRSSPKSQHTYLFRLSTPLSIEYAIRHFKNNPKKSLCHPTSTQTIPSLPIYFKETTRKIIDLLKELHLPWDTVTCFHKYKIFADSMPSRERCDDGYDVGVDLLRDMKALKKLVGEICTYIDVLI